MEIAKVELQEIEKVSVAGAEGQLNALTDLELVLIGGGCGDITLG
jgi:hypothetical protein